MRRFDVEDRYGQENYIGRDELDCYRDMLLFIFIGRDVLFDVVVDLEVEDQGGLQYDFEDVDEVIVDQRWIVFGDVDGDYDGGGVNVNIGECMFVIFKLGVNN